MGGESQLTAVLKHLGGTCFVYYMHIVRDRDEQLVNSWVRQISVYTITPFIFQCCIAVFASTDQFNRDFIGFYIDSTELD